MITTCATLALAGGLIGGVAPSNERNIQMRSIDFAAGVVELHNCGDASVDLSGWRFCSHDDDEFRRYSSNTGLIGFSIAPGASLYLHWNDDAPGGDPARVNVSTIGGNFAQPMDNDSWGLQLYFMPVQFGNGNQIADHLQWSIDGIDNLTADERSDEAEAGGVWTDQTTWIATSATTTYLRLTDTSCGILHGPANYEALDAMPDCNMNGLDDFFEIADGSLADADMNGVPDICEGDPCPGDATGDDMVNFDDLNAVLGAWNTTVPPGTSGDVSGDGQVNFDDLNAVLGAWGADCT